MNLYRKLPIALYLLFWTYFVTPAPVYGLVLESNETSIVVDMEDYKRNATPLGFILPNENYPQDADYYWKRSLQEGVYISVGTQRGIIGALATNSRYVVLIDFHANTVVYNRALILLLKVADGRREIFRNMMTNPRSFAFNVNRANLNQTEKAWLLNLAATDFWAEVLNQQSSHSFFKNRPQSAFDEFYGHNYLRSEKQFQQLTALARENRISAVRLDLGDVNAVSELAQELKQKGLPISVLDMSNAWQGGGFSRSAFLGSERTQTAITLMKPAMSSESRILLTAAYQNFTRRFRAHDRKKWAYYSSTLKELEEKKFFDSSLPKEELGQERFMNKYFPGTPDCMHYLEGD